MKTLTLAAGFIGCILAANYVTTEYGMVTMLGIGMTAGTFFAGATFVIRDSLQDALDGPSDRAANWLWKRGIRWSPGRLSDYIQVAAIMALITAGAMLSVAISAPFIALASGVAFLASETADLAVYTPLRKRGYIKAAVASNVVGSLVDTLLFLSIAGFPLAALPGQMFGKLLVTLAVVALVSSLRVYQTVTE